MDLVLELPIELASEILGKWLPLKSLVRLDTGYCHTSKRPLLHTIFLSPSHILSAPSDNYVRRHELHQITDWIVARGIRAEVIHLGESIRVEEYEQYLQNHGNQVLCARIGWLRERSGVVLGLLARFCKNLRIFDYFISSVSPEFITMLQACSQLESVRMQAVGPFRPKIGNVPSTHHLNLMQINTFCDRQVEECIFKMSRPESVQQLRLSGVGFLPEWSRLTSLRSFGFKYYEQPADHTMLAVLSQLPWIINLDLSQTTDLRDDVAVSAVGLMRRLRSLNIDNCRGVTDVTVDALVQHHRSSLEAVFLLNTGVIAAGINKLLSDCTKLHTISYTTCRDIDYALMSNITTLSTTSFEYNKSMWRAAGQHWRSLQHLHLVFAVTPKTANIGMMSAILAMPKIRAVYVVCKGVCCYSNPVLVALQRDLPSVHSSEGGESWYKFFDLPIELL